MNKKTYEFTVYLDDYGSEQYNSNIVTPSEYDKSGNFEKLNMLYSICELINSEINKLELE